MARTKIAIACQGGGSQTAFTAGALKALSEERREIADRAYARAHREHTYERRLRRVLEVLGLASETDSHAYESTAIGHERE